MFEGIYGQEAVKKRLKNLIESDRMSNAYIFSGPSGVGKFLVAKEFSRQLLGISPDNSPDFKLIEAKKNESSIKIDKIRNLKADISIKPNGKYKIYIIDEAEKMTDQAQNALLKTLEEPSSYGIIILVTKNEQALLETIRSRCLDVRFSPLMIDDIQKILVDKGIDHDRVAVSAIFSRGSASLAIDIAQRQEFSDMRKLVEDYLILSLVDKKSYESTLFLDMFKDYSNQIGIILEMMTLYIRDTILYREGLSDLMMINKDRVNIIKKIGQAVGVGQLARLISIIDTTNTKLDANCNYNTSIQAMSLNIFEVVNKW